MVTPKWSCQFLFLLYLLCCFYHRLVHSLVWWKFWEKGFEIRLPGNLSDLARNQKSKHRKKYNQWIQLLETTFYFPLVIYITKDEIKFEPVLNYYFKSFLASQGKLLLWSSWKNKIVLSTCSVEINKQHAFCRNILNRTILSCFRFGFYPHSSKKKRKEKKQRKKVFVERNVYNINREFLFPSRQQ